MRMELLLSLILSSSNKIYLCLGIKASTMHGISVFLCGSGYFPLSQASPIFIFFHSLCPEDLFVGICY